MTITRILLSTDIVFATGLSYDDAVDAMSLASKTPANEFVEFSIHGPACEDGWRLIGTVRELATAFLSNPDQFVIRVGDCSKEKSESVR